ncbi:MAG: hypothetical protein ABF370_17240 [Verrucomicrobiales bacterium]|nr:hypothetical protein [Verrucomicrobiaceae bacterium]
MVTPAYTILVTQHHLQSVDATSDEMKLLELRQRIPYRVRTLIRKDADAVTGGGG